MTNSIPEAANSAIFDPPTVRMLIAGSLVIVVLLILWCAGVLKRLETFSLKFFKNFGFHMGFGKGRVGEVETSGKNRGMRKGQVKKPTDVAKLKAEIGSVLAARKKALIPPPPNFEANQINRGFSKLNDADSIEAKKCFDSVLQRNPKSVDALFGLARVLELRKDIPNAVKYYWEAARTGDKSHPRAIEAEAKLDELSKLQRQQKVIKAITKSEPGPNNFWFERVPEAIILARYFVALSNSEDGGNIVVGMDAVSREPTGHDLNGWKDVLDSVRWHYVTAPCLFEVSRSEQPRCILVVIERGLNRPYRVNNDDDEEAKIFVTDGAGGVREATAEEAKELRKKKRG